VVPIPGSRTPEHVAENVAAGWIVLDDDTLRRVDDALAAFEPEGGTLL
jgi:aryl-alcohol dehydrogenase-like predicted oxidoreductase